MRSVVLVSLAAAIGNMLQGWDNATIAGAVIYIKKEFHLEKEPKIEGLIVAMSLIGATMITTFSGPVSDKVGRRSMLILSSLLYFLSSLVMFWSPNVYVLLFARLLDGFGIGLAVTLVPIYISETAPSEIRGLLNTFPQFCGSGGMFLSYCLVFGMSLQESPSWRLMLGVLSIPSVLYFLLAAFFLPESPRWLARKGRMEEARHVLQRLRELALLVEGLGVGKDTSIEEYVIGPDNEVSEGGHELPRKDQIRLYGPEDGQSWMAKPVKGPSSLALASRQGSMITRGGSLIDPVVTLFGSIHEKLPSENMNSSSSRSMIFPNMGSILGLMGRQESQWDPERNNDDSSEHDESLNSPLLSPQTTESGSVGTMHGRQSSLFMANVGETATATSIGGGWQLAWKYNDKVGADGQRVNGGLQRMYIHEESSNNKPNNTGFSRRGSLLSFHTEAGVSEQSGYIQAAALVSQASMIPGTKGETAMLPKEIKAGPGWRELKEPGVKRALMVGVGLQILQQFAGINGVMYYTPQILKETGVSSLLSNLGIGAESASLLISSLTTLFMLPCILVSMRSLMLSTIPILILSLLTLVIGSLVKLGGTANALISTASVMVYLSCFVMGFGAIPNILCSEIFPTSVRGLCITICALTFWICDIIVTYTLPVMLKSLGLAGVFGIYAFVCAVAWVFVYLKVPETKGMPLEVISEFFSVGAKQQDAASFVSV
ncbi:hypothetical protein DY000_02055950 [Brassica cretica]|uniref:Major facilitator superfamily (MFS) profile domain-containing protein n=1 Tax=Brassica cretica TaxID=69181 RepID=A0ABQ7AB72_BRACR|nr:hypothetical protein DY000_02055950 [Brassica cretica]